LVREIRRIKGKKGGGVSINRFFNLEHHPDLEIELNGRETIHLGVIKDII
jgi:hypothetical protein